MTRMLMALLMLGGIAMAQPVLGRELAVEVGAEKITVEYTLLNRNITEKDLNTGDCNSAVSCSMLYHNLLGKGDIKKASLLSTDPGKTEKKWQDYEKRVGADLMQQLMKEFFTSGNIIQVELFKGQSHMLLIRTPEYVVAQFFVATDKGYFVDEERLSEDARLLGDLFPKIQDGEINLE